MGFVAIVIVINVVENVGLNRPDPTADVAAIAEWAGDADAYLWVTTTLVPLSWIMLAVFAVTLRDRVRSVGADRTPALLGVVATAMTMGTLSVAIAIDAVLIAHIDDLSLEVVRVLSGLSTVIFLLNWAALALALYGLSRAAVSIGLLPRWLDRLSLVGAALLVAGSVQSAVVVNGTLEGLLAGLVGFAIWLLFLTVTGFRLARAEESAPARASMAAA